MAKSAPRPGSGTKRGKKQKWPWQTKMLILLGGMLAALVVILFIPVATPVVKSADGAPARIFLMTRVQYTEAAGTYDLVPGRKVNGMPVWKQSGGGQPETFIFSGTKQEWIVGPSDAAVDGGNGGWLRSFDYGLEWPHDVEGPWRYKKEEALHEDEDATIACSSSPPDRIAVSSPVHFSDVSGAYKIVPGYIINGLPVWKQAGQNSAVYSGANGDWLVGGMNEAEDGSSQGRIKSKAHGGAWPDRVKGRWSHSEKPSGEWSEADTIKCTRDDTVAGLASAPVHDET